MPAARLEKLAKNYSVYNKKTTKTKRQLLKALLKIPSIAYCICLLKENNKKTKLDIQVKGDSYKRALEILSTVTIAEAKKKEEEEKKEKGEEEGQDKLIQILLLKAFKVSSYQNFRLS